MHGIKVFVLQSSSFIIIKPFLHYYYLQNTDDTVFMAEEIKRQEYILNDIGKIYIGSHSKPKGRQWIYGQVSVFQEIV